MVALPCVMKTLTSTCKSWRPSLGTTRSSRDSSTCSHHQRSRGLGGMGSVSQVLVHSSKVRRTWLGKGAVQTGWQEQRGRYQGAH